VIKSGVCAKNYQNRERFDEIIAKIERSSLFAPYGTAQPKLCKVQTRTCPNLQTKF